MAPYTPRNEAKWKAALGELLNYDLLEMTSSRNAGGTYSLTEFGYRLAEELGAKPPEEEQSEG